MPWPWLLVSKGKVLEWCIKDLAEVKQTPQLLHTNSKNKFKINKINNIVLQLYECACVSNLPQELF